MATLERKQSRLLNVYLEEGIGHDQFTRENEKMAGELARLKDESKGLVNLMEKWQPGDIKRDWAILGLLERQEVLGAFIDYIVIKPGRMPPRESVVVHWTALAA